MEKQKIEVRWDAKKDQAEAYVGPVLLAAGGYAEVRKEVKKVEFAIYRTEGKFPTLFYPYGRFADSGEWIPRV